MYERFTDRAREVIKLATQEAHQFNDAYIGSQHILLGMVKERSGMAANVLKNLGVDSRAIRLEVERLLASNVENFTLDALPWTPSAKRVIEYSMEEAVNLDHNYVGTEHILLGLLRDRETVAAQVLMTLGLRLEQVRAEIRKILRELAADVGNTATSQAAYRVRDQDAEAKAHAHQQAVAHVDFGSWAFRVLAWDGFLPAFVLLVPLLIGIFLPNHRGLVNFVGLTFPVTAFLIRLFVGLRHISSNGCSDAFQVVQACLLFVGVLVLVLVDTMLILSREVQGVFANRTDNIALAVSVLIYLTCLIIAMYPGQRKEG